MASASSYKSSGEFLNKSTDFENDENEENVRANSHRIRDPEEARGEERGKRGVPIKVKRRKIWQVDGIFATTIYRYVLGIIAGGDKTRSRVGGALV